MDGRLSDDNIATRQGATAIEVSLRFQLPSTTVCTTSFLDLLAGIIVTSVGRTHKNLLRLYCSQSTVKVQILNTYVPVKNMRSSDDVALELQRQLSFPDSPLRTNISSVDPSFRPPPIEVINCSENSLLFQPSCAQQSLQTPPWLGLEPNSYSTILIFVSVGVLICLLCSICALCLRRCWRNKKQGEDKAKWIFSVQKEQALELEGAKGKALTESPETSSEHLLLPATIALPSFPMVSTPSPSPRSVPPLQDPDTDSNCYQDYGVETPLSEHVRYSGIEPDIFVLEACTRTSAEL